MQRAGVRGGRGDRRAQHGLAIGIAPEAAVELGEVDRRGGELRTEPQARPCIRPRHRWRGRAGHKKFPSVERDSGRSALRRWAATSSAAARSNGSRSAAGWLAVGTGREQRSGADAHAADRIGQERRDEVSRAALAARFPACRARRSAPSDRDPSGRPAPARHLPATRASRARSARSRARTPARRLTRPQQAAPPHPCHRSRPRGKPRRSSGNPSGPDRTSARSRPRPIAAVLSAWQSLQAFGVPSFADRSGRGTRKL